MRALLVIPLLFVAESVAGEHQFVSPSGEFEAFATAANDDGSGMKLYLRRANSDHSGVLLRQSNRWIDAKWSPDSHFLAVIDHFDGHISDVYVFGVATAEPIPTLLYHTPDQHSYDVKCEVAGWDLSRREIVLDKKVKHEVPGWVTHEKIVARIGTEPLSFNQLTNLANYELSGSVGLFTQLLQVSF